MNLVSSRPSKQWTYLPARLIAIGEVKKSPGMRIGSRIGLSRRTLITHQSLSQVFGKNRRQSKTAYTTTTLVRPNPTKIYIALSVMFSYCQVKT